MIKMGNNKHTSLKYGSLSIASIVVVIIIAVFINLIMLKLDIKVDTTPNKIYSLSDKTKEIIKNVGKEVTVYGLFDDGQIPNDVGDTSGYQTYYKAVEILDQYSKLTSKITVKYIDPVKEPSIMTELDPQGTMGLSKGNFIFKCGNKIDKVSEQELQASYQSQQDEQDVTNFLTAEFSFTSAIKRVTADKSPTIYFTEGHQESQYNTEYQLLQKTLEAGNYETKGINLITEEKIPDDAEAIFVLSPKKDLTPSEQQKIYDYLYKGGKAMFLFDSVTPNANFPQFDKVLGDFGMTLNYDRVKETDKNRHDPNNPNTFIVSPEVNDINVRINNKGAQLVMSNARSINVLKTSKTGLEVKPLIKSGDKAIGEQIDKSKGDDLKGPLVLAAAAEYSSTESRVAVIGNARIFSDVMINQYDDNSMYFFVDVYNWLLDKEEDLQIPPKTIDSQRLAKITESKAKTAGVILMVVIPILILAAGTLVWVRRRHL